MLTTTATTILTFFFDLPIESAQQIINNKFDHRLIFYTYNFLSGLEIMLKLFMDCEYYNIDRAIGWEYLPRE